jgi:hypothetical protein
MPGDNRNRWMSPQLKLLEEMHAAGRQWPAIVTAVGHSLSSCQQMLSRIRGAKRNAEFERARLERRASPKAPIAIAPPLKPTLQQASVPDPPSARSTSTARLLMDAELRARIAVLGVTAGLLGDPMPGRSALDRIRAGMVDPPPPIDRKTVHRPQPKITLAATESAE